MKPRSFVARLLTLALPVITMLTMFSVPAAAGVRETGRQLIGDRGAAIVTVAIVSTVKVTYGNQDIPEREVKSETSGTVIGPDGLTIIPLAAIDPTSMYKEMMSEGMSFDNRVKSIKLVVRKETEIPATVVLRDADLGVAFLRPLEKPAQPLTAIDLKDAAEPELLEEVCVLARMGKVADNELGAMTGEIQAIVSKPRKFYVPSAELASGGFGVPIFTAQSKLVGIVLMRVAPGGDDTESFGGGGDGGMLAIILPAADVQEVAGQAPMSAPLEEKPAAESKPSTSTQETK
jgi:hypothetical protein